MWKQIELLLALWLGEQKEEVEEAEVEEGVLLKRVLQGEWGAWHYGKCEFDSETIRSVVELRIVVVAIGILVTSPKMDIRMIVNTPGMDNYSHIGNSRDLSLQTSADRERRMMQRLEVRRGLREAGRS